jgi:hypothetical protein
VVCSQVLMRSAIHAERMGTSCFLAQLAPRIPITTLGRGVHVRGCLSRMLLSSCLIASGTTGTGTLPLGSHGKATSKARAQHALRRLVHRAPAPYWPHARNGLSAAPGCLPGPTDGSAPTRRRRVGAVTATHHQGEMAQHPRCSASKTTMRPRKPNVNRGRFACVGA